MSTSPWVDARNQQVDRQVFDPTALAPLSALRPGLFADTRVYVSSTDAAAMRLATAAIERAVHAPGWLTLPDRGSEASSGALGELGVCVGVDFHLTPEGPRLIEVNTNAGGEFLNLALLRAQRDWPEASRAAALLEIALVSMFKQEWQRSQGATARPLKTIAIVDETPEAQYLYPDFLACRTLLESQGWQVLIAAPAEFRWQESQLWHGETPVDLVYNRLTDFTLESAGNRPLREAWEAGAICLTPHPEAHARYADKRNLVRLADAELLARLGLDAADRAAIARVNPHSEVVDGARADDFWARRKQLFFKPVAGYGGKAVYRGQSVTKKVFAEIMAGDYVAQTYAPPATRQVQVGEETVELKWDLRCYAYAGEVQLMAARLWQGQTTNFRTPGGGFAPVCVLES